MAVGLQLDPKMKQTSSVCDIYRQYQSSFYPQNINCITIRIYFYRHTCTPTTPSIFCALKFPCVFMRMLRLYSCAVVEDTYIYGRTYSLGTFITTKRKCPFLPQHIRGQAAILHCSCAKKPGDERRPEVL